MAWRRAALLAAAIASARGAEPFLAKEQSITQQAAKVAAAGPGIFEFNCESSDDFGYPRFNSLDELKASAWSEYFVKIYGELPPADGYPVCVFDFWHIQNMSSPSFTKLGLKQPDPNKAGGKPHGWQIPTFFANILSQYYPGIAYRYTKGEYVNGDLFSTEASSVSMVTSSRSVTLGWPPNQWPHLSPVSHSYTLYREWYLYHQIPDNGWVEVMHMAGPFFKRETEAMWFSRSRGSGVYFNVGKTIAFNTHQDGFIQFLVDKSGPCKLPKPEVNSTDPMAQGAVFENAISMCLRSKGYDSFQFRPYPYPV